MAAEQPRDMARTIWQAGVEAVKPDVLMRRWVRVERDRLVIGQQQIPLSSIRRIAVVGAGKAGSAMAEAIENVLGEDLLQAKPP